MGGRESIAQEPFEKSYQSKLQLITRHQQMMKQKLVKLIDKILLCKHSLIKIANDQLKKVSQLEVFGNILLTVLLTDCLYLFT